MLVRRAHDAAQLDPDPQHRLGRRPTSAPPGTAHDLRHDHRAGDHRGRHRRHHPTRRGCRVYRVRSRTATTSSPTTAASSTTPATCTARTRGSPSSRTTPRASCSSPTPAARWSAGSRPAACVPDAARGRARRPAARAVPRLGPILRARRHRHAARRRRRRATSAPWSTRPGRAGSDRHRERRAVAGARARVVRRRRSPAAPAAGLSRTRPRGAARPAPPPRSRWPHLDRGCGRSSSARSALQRAAGRFDELRGCTTPLPVDQAGDPGTAGASGTTSATAPGRHPDRAGRPTAGRAGPTCAAAAVPRAGAASAAPDPNGTGANARAACRPVRS